MAEQSRTEFEIFLEQKKSGDELDRLAVEMAAREGIKYSQAFQRISILQPELVKKYRGIAA